ncbi:YhgE/Pip domain-containing protein [Jeotgalibacillus proteolyticus]|uniref:ABC-2 type transporter transmembrane domain-containing protein n=1 Tax=Jeotgalibacillus proteolyticus TaxID=2082395 RepID=A0A2S5GDQ2_9BACL|nr:YhgE/Pip domain-containing protein [Jeotgalibacillus proteolyticus]PPA71126.1 hypothetical protein C4B60_10185 [Jeotgalibacillus proteolyticus]
MNMIKAEWRKILSDRKLVIVILGLLFIPMVYASIFLIASWDPYSKVDQLPVAVVNEDMTYKFGDENLAVGDELVKNLEGNQSLEWHFTDRSEAMDGIENGDYYMTVIIPEDFSEHAASVLDEDPKEMVLEYYTSGGRSFMGERITESAAQALDKEVAESVTLEYARTMLSQLGEIGDGFHEAADGAGEVRDGNVELKDGIGKLAASLLTFENGLKTTEEGSKELAIKVGDVVTGMNDLKAGIYDYTSGVSTLADGISQYVNGVEQFGSGVDRLSGGLKDFDEGIGRYTSGVNQLDQGIQRYTSEIDSINQGVQGYANDLLSLREEVLGSQRAIPSLIEEVGRLQERGDTLSTGSHNLSDYLSGVEGDLRSLSEQASLISQSIDQLPASEAPQQKSAVGESAMAEKNTEQMNLLLQELQALQEAPASTGGQPDTGAAQEALNALEQEVNALNSQADSSAGNDYSWIEASGVDLSDEERDQLIQAFNQSGGTNQSTVSTDLLTESIGSVRQAINGIESTNGPSADVTAAILQTETLIQTNQELLNALGNSEERVVPSSANSNAAGELGELAASLTEGIEQSTNRVSQAREQAGSLDQTTETLFSGLNDYTSGVEQELNFDRDWLSDKTTEALEGANQLEEATHELASGSIQLNQQSSALTSGSRKLTGAGDELQQASSQLDAGGQKVTDGANELTANNQRLNGGAQALADGMPQVESALWSLNGGLNQLTDGAGELNNGSIQLEDGSGKLADGSGELAAGLEDGAAELDGIHREDKNAEMFSSPTELKGNHVTDLPNYGYGLAPYMMSIALFIGAVIFCLLVPVNTSAITPSSGLSWWTSKFSLLSLVSILQGSILVGVMMLIGINPESSVLELFAVAIVSSLAFMALVQFFAVVFGNPGRFLVLVLMVLQLSASGGTFPVELLNDFLRSINPFLPMTHSINAYREVISIGGSPGSELLILLGYFAVFHLGTILFFTFKTKRIKKKASLEEKAA